MIKINNEIYRNIQEQVQANKDAIEAFTNVEFTLNNMGIKVLGKVKQPSDIPIGTREFGDAYLVGISEPYDIWIYTRTLTPGAEGTFINMGPLTIVGPRGEQGDPGEPGADGYAPVVRYGAGLPIVQSTDKNGYLYINTNNSDIYTFDNGWKFVVSSRGPAGPQGPQGIQGATGTTLSIVGKLASESLLPTDFASGNILKNTAYLVTKSNATHLYIIMGNQNDYSTWYWQDVGDFNLGSVIYKNNEFQYSIDVVDTYNTTTGSVVTDTATNKLYNDLFSNISADRQSIEDLRAAVSAEIGETANLQTESKQVVGAINEVNNVVKTNVGNIADNRNKIAALNNNITEINNNLVNINEQLNAHSTQITNAVNRIEEVNTNLAGEIINTNTNIGDLASLATNDKTNIVAAINEVKNSSGGSGGGLAIKSITYSDILLDHLYLKIEDLLAANNNRNLVKVRLKIGTKRFPSNKFKTIINTTDGSMSTAAYTTDSYLSSDTQGIDFYISGAGLSWKNLGDHYDLVYDRGKQIVLKGILSDDKPITIILDTVGSRFGIDEKIFYNSSTSELIIYPKIDIYHDSFGSFDATIYYLE